MEPKICWQVLTSAEKECTTRNKNRETNPLDCVTKPDIHKVEKENSV
jgi:hypothetical protein